MAAADYANVVQQLYVSYFGRPADYYGLQNFEAQLNTMGAPTTVAGIAAAVQAGTNVALVKLVNSFNAAPESVALYGAGTTQIEISKFVADVYTNVLGRPADVAGANWWINEIVSGRLTKANAALAISAGALTNTTDQGKIDAATITAKVAVATDFTTSLDTIPEINAFSGDAAAAAARAMLATVTNTTTVATFHATVDATIAALGTAATAGQTFTLTEKPDVVTGTAGNDTINGILINNGTVAADATSTLNVSDVLDGAAGTDTLSILVAGANSSAAAPLAATLSVTKNVEVLSVKNLVTGTQNGVTVDASTATGLTQVVNNASTGAVAVTGVAANATVSVQNSKAATSVTFAADTFKAATTVANVAVNNAGTATADASIVLNDGGTVTATSLAIQADGTSYVAVTGTALAALATLTVTGSGSLDFDVTSARNGSLTKVDASALTGGLTFTAANAAKTAITGGHGNDVISIAAAMAATSTISLGDGNDAVKFATGGSVLAGAVIDGGAGVDTFDLKLVDASNINSFANFEVASLDSLATATYDLGLLAAKNTLTGLSLTAGGTNTATVSNVAAGSTLTVNGGTTTGLTLAEKGAAASTTDSLNITFGAKAAASVSATINEVETLNIVSGGDKGVANTFNLTSATFTTASAASNATEKLVVTGANDLTLNVSAATAANTKVVVDGSAATGKLTITGSTTTTTITGGSADDLITVANAATTVATGAGKDVVDVSAAVGGTNITSITNFAVGDSITSAAEAAGAAGKIGATTSLAGATDVATVLATLFAAADAASSHAAWAAVGTDVYLVLDGGVALANANVVKLTGVTDLSTWTFDTAGHFTVA